MKNKKKKIQSRESYYNFDKTIKNITEKKNSYRLVYGRGWQIQFDILGNQ